MKVFLTAHAEQRFAERFPGLVLMDVYSRSKRIPARKVMDVYFARNRAKKVRIGDIYKHDPVTDCLFVTRIQDGMDAVVTCFPLGVPDKKRRKFHGSYEQE